jgi:hypothetical protein
MNLSRRFAPPSTAAQQDCVQLRHHATVATLCSIPGCRLRPLLKPFQHGSFTAASFRTWPLCQCFDWPHQASLVNAYGCGVDNIFETCKSVSCHKHPRLSQAPAPVTSTLAWHLVRANILRGRPQPRHLHDTHANPCLSHLEPTTPPAPSPPPSPATRQPRCCVRRCTRPDICLAPAHLALGAGRPLRDWE